MAKQLREKASVIERDITERTRALAEERREENGGEPEEVKRVVQAVLEHAFRAIEGREDRQPPPEVAAHARLLAWKGLRTHTVLRRYEAGAAVFKEHLRQVRSSVKPYSEDAYSDAERAIEGVFEQLQDRVESEHIQEEQGLKSSPEARKRKRVNKILSGKLIYPPKDLHYDFSATHIGVVGSGAGVEGEIRRLAQMLGVQPLIVQGLPSQFWAWIGLKRQSSAGRLDDVLKEEWAPRAVLAIGAPTAGLLGWRLTHQEARAAFPIAVRMPGSVVPYRGVALLAALARDTLACTTLCQTYLDPLTNESDSGQDLRETLHAYFAAECNVSSTAAAINVSRKTVRNRLNVVEGRIGRPISEVGMELQAAIHLQHCSPR